MIQLLIVTWLVVCFFYDCFSKWKWLDIYAVIRKKWMPNPECSLCISFWITFFLGYPIYLVYVSNWWGILIPFCVASLINQFKK